MRVLCAMFLFICVTAGICSPLDHALISSYAATDDTVWLEENPHLSMTPASCMKVVTTAAALHLLGPEMRFETNLEYDGLIKEGTLHGNLYIHGHGDPCLGSGRVDGSLDWQQQIAVWVNAVQALGIQKIEGTIIGDATDWESALAVPSWCWEDLGNYYGAGASALSFHENAYTLTFKPGSAVGDQTLVAKTDPPMRKVAFQNEVTTGAPGSGDQACIFGSEFSTTQRLRGTIPALVDTFSIRGAIADPAHECANLLEEALANKGIRIGERECLATTPRFVFHTSVSPPLKEIVYWVNQKSINLYAEHLLKKMGEVLYKEGSTAAGVKAVVNFWQSQGIDLEGFYMADGSGLSRKNLVTAHQMVQILLKMQKSPHFPTFLRSLPQEMDATHAKSGSMSLIKGYVGYRGDTAFAVFINHCPDREAVSASMETFFKKLTSCGKTL